MEEAMTDLRQGWDEASGHWYRVVSTTSTSSGLGEDMVSPVHGLRVHFKYFPYLPTNSSFITLYRLDLSGWIAPSQRDAITVLLQHHGVPLAALNTFLDLIFGARGVETIKACVDIVTFHAHVPSHIDREVNADTTIELLDDELNGALEIMLRRRHPLKPRTTRDVVDALEKVTINGSETSSCAICLNELLLGSVATKMPCSHVFHGDCIVKWLDKKYDCPLCRFELPSAS